jgi:hypothetical protein
MVMWEDAFLALSERCPHVDIEDLKTRYRTLLAVARQYRTGPECFGVVKIWRPKAGAAHAHGCDAAWLGQATAAE